MVVAHDHLVDQAAQELLFQAGGERVDRGEPAAVQAAGIRAFHHFDFRVVEEQAGLHLFDLAIGKQAVAGVNGFVQPWQVEPAGGDAGVGVRGGRGYQQDFAHGARAAEVADIHGVDACVDGDRGGAGGDGEFFAMVAVFMAARVMRPQIRKVVQPEFFQARALGRVGFHAGGEVGVGGGHGVTAVGIGAAPRSSFAASAGHSIHWPRGGKSHPMAGVAMGLWWRPGTRWHRSGCRPGRG